MTNPNPNNPNNPNNFLPQFVIATHTMPVQDVWNHFGPATNPYIHGTQQHTTFSDLVEAHHQQELSRFSKLPDVIVNGSVKRRLNHPCLKPTFETLYDINLRLRGTIIFVGGKLYYVNSSHKHGTDFLLVLEDSSGKCYKALYYDCKGIDLRSVEPQYFIHENQPSFFSRPPFRQQQQGVSTGNSSHKLVGDTRWHRLENSRILMRGLQDNNVIWSAQFLDLMVKARAFKSIRLSKDIALFSKGTHLYSEYKGRTLGVVQDNIVFVDETDIKMPWIKKDAAYVGLEVRQQ